MKNSKVLVPDGEIYFESIGKGEPLILIHAGFSDRRDWKYQVGDFEKKFNTIVYDQRGFGNSSVLTKAFSPADDLKALMDHLKITKAVLVGHSLGGTIALDFALQYPERVSALVLLASGLNGYLWSKEYLEWMNSIWSMPQPDEMTKQYLSASFYRVAMGDPNIKLEIETITNESFQKVLTWKTFDIQDVRWFFSDHLPRLKELNMPTLVVTGDKDSQDIKQIAHAFSDNLRNIKIAQVKNTDHLLNFENPSELNSLVLNFLLNCEFKSEIY